MFRTKNPNQMTIFDPLEDFGPKRKKLLKKSWAYFFRHHVLPEIPVQKVSSTFTGFGRPSKELYSTLGLLILQQTFDLSDNEALSQFAFNTQWHYALNITSSNDDATYMCEKTLYNIRNVIIQNNLWDNIFHAITGALIEQFEVDTDKQRLDSTHIQSNMQSLGRIGIFSKTIQTFLTNLKRQQRPLFNQLPESLVGRYFKQKQLAAFSMVKPSDSAKTLKTLSKDLHYLVRAFEKDQIVISMTSFTLLKRVLDEQCEIIKADYLETKPTIAEPKAPKDIPSDSLQNPSDPEAGYDGHKGKGYQVQVMETWSEDRSDHKPNLITYISVEPAHVHDSKAVIPAIESTDKRNIKPKELLADSLYGSDDNTVNAKELGVDLVSPTLTGASKNDKLHLNDFLFNRKNRIRLCPGNRPPIFQIIKKETVHTRFNLKHCAVCSLCEQCPVTRTKKYTRIRYSYKDVRLAKRRQYEKTPAFIKKYAFRAGVEATMSEYKQLTGVGRLRVRGAQSVSFYATLKALGVNILRSASAYYGFQKHSPTSAVANLVKQGCNRNLAHILGFTTIQIQNLRQFWQQFQKAYEYHKFFVSRSVRFILAFNRKISFLNGYNF